MYIFIYVYMCCQCVYVQYEYRYQWRLEKGFRSPGTGVAVGGEPPDVGVLETELEFSRIMFFFFFHSFSAIYLWRPSLDLLFIYLLETVHHDPTASAFGVLGLQLYTTMLILRNYFKIRACSKKVVPILYWFSKILKARKEGLL